MIYIEHTAGPSVAPHASRAKNTVYAVDDQGKEPDAVETLFVGALGLAHDLAHLYQV